MLSSLSIKVERLGWACKNETNYFLYVSNTVMAGTINSYFELKKSKLVVKMLLGFLETFVLNGRVFLNEPINDWVGTVVWRRETRDAKSSKNNPSASDSCPRAP